MTEILERPLPHNLEAERAVLGAVLLNPVHVLTDLVELLQPRDFFRDAHRRIFDAILTLDHGRHAIDFVTLKHELGRTGSLDEVGGPAYLASLTDGVPHGTHVRYYAGIVREAATLRAIIFAATHTLAAAYEAEQSPLEILDQGTQTLMDLRYGATHKDMESVRILTQQVIGEIAEPVDQSGLSGAPSGITALDALTSGFQPSDSIVVGARTSVGKTAFAASVALAAAKAGWPVTFFTMEMSAHQVLSRMVSAESLVERMRFTERTLTEEHWRRASAALQRIAALPIEIDQTPAITLSELRGKVRRKLTPGRGLVIIDYTQLMTPPRRGREINRNQEVSDLSHGIKALAMDFNVPVLALSQLSRAPEHRHRPDKRPQLSDLRDSGSLEMDADVVLLLHRQDAAGPQQEQAIIEIIVGKQRNGPTGVVKAAWVRRLATFGNLRPAEIGE